MDGEANSELGGAMSWTAGDDTGGARRPRRRRLLFATAVLGAIVFVPQSLAASSITIQAKELGGGALPAFTYLVNDDNVGDPGDPNPANHPGRRPTPSNSPVVATGDEGSATLSLPDGKYLITVRAPGYKLWGRHVTLPAQAGTIAVELLKQPLPLPKLVVHVFHDNAWVNSAPDTGEQGLGGFNVVLEDQSGGEVTVNHLGEPLCGGACVTDAEGNVTIENLSPALYKISVIPPDGEGWIQTTTFEGGFPIASGLEEGSNGLGAPLEELVTPTGIATAHWYGFVKELNFSVPGTGTITGTARTWVEWPPFQDLTFGQPVADAYVALSDTATDQQVWTGRADAGGAFTIPNVPAGLYQVSIWDEPLQAIIRFFAVQVDPGQTVDLGDVGVSRWFGWLSGDVYLDQDQNGVRDPGEPGLAGIDLDTRWRDGSIDKTTVTNSLGYYEYPEAEGGPVGRFFIGEVGFGRFGTTGASLHDEYSQFAGGPPDTVTPVPSELSGGLLTNQFILEAHRSIVDWGKYRYAEGETGSIVGLVLHGTTRNELNARLQAAEDYEPGIPGVTVRLWGLGDDLMPNTLDDVLLNEVQTDAWAHPSGCDVLDKNGVALPDLPLPNVGAPCIEVPKISNETKDGAFDGGFAFSTYCPAGYPCAAADERPLVPGDYVVEAVTPDHYQVVREEDVNVNEGDALVPQIPPAPCAGDDHVVDVAGIAPDGANAVDNPTFADAGGSPYEGQPMPLCTKRLVSLQAEQNPEANFFFFTDNGVQLPGRILGLVTDDINFDTDPNSMWYGEARPLRNIPVGIRDFQNRLITTLTTDENGYYEVLLPSTQTANSPIPQGISPGLYRVVVNDPGDLASPNLSFNQDYLTAALTFDVWPGKTTQADTPLDPISGTACAMPARVPEFFSVDRVTMPRSGGNRRLTIRGVGFGASQGTYGRVRFSNGLASIDLAVTSWSDTTIVGTVPSLRFLQPSGPYQMTVRAGGPAGAGGGTAFNGITLHLLGSGYNPQVVSVHPSPTGTPIQNAIDAAGPNTLIVVDPGAYRENVILYKKLKLQGFGPGGVVGNPGGTGVEDPRNNVPGTVVNGRYWQENEAAWRAKLASLTYSNPGGPVPGGAAVTVVAHAGAFTANFPAAIDGFGITSARATDPNSGGGIYVNAYASGLQIANNIIEGNSGSSTGGVQLGRPYVGDNVNNNVRLHHNRMIGNGGYLDTGGGGAIGIFSGASDYEIDQNQICSNFSMHYGAGISHFGQSTGGRIHDNKIYYNDAVDEGGGIQIAGQPSLTPAAALGSISGDVTIERNLIQANSSDDDGGGINLLGPLDSRIEIRNNMIVNNHAADLGGGVSLDDASNVVIVNNTIARNDTTASATDSVPGVPRGAGLVSQAHSPVFQASPLAAGTTFSNPRALFNNIFWENQAYTLDLIGQELGPAAVLDLEVVGTAGAFCPRYSLLTAPYPTGSSCPPGPNNRVGLSPNFVAPVFNQLDLQLSRLNPAETRVTLVRADPPQGLSGNYHVGSGGAIGGGAVGLNASTLAVCGPIALNCFPAPLFDYDFAALQTFGYSQFPFVPPSAARVPPPDIGADERLPALPVPLQ